MWQSDVQTILRVHLTFSGLKSPLIINIQTISLHTDKKVSEKFPTRSLMSSQTLSEAVCMRWVSHSSVTHSLEEWGIWINSLKWSDASRAPLC